MISVYKNEIAHIEVSFEMAQSYSLGVRPCAQ